ncbi:Hypothetical predicted protein [Pelobates cultripes]|uniref:Uncharacterized protein n=1 Tax=Pelobates cultripes TaxID=61616 RepID=A0AAD1SPY1_PELCU|nr:Hypothetical predicted protein [Pelobates cultripes]
MAETRHTLRRTRPPQRFCQEQELHNKWQISPGAMTTDNIWIEQMASVSSGIGLEALRAGIKAAVWEHGMEWLQEELRDAALADGPPVIVRPSAMAETRHTLRRTRPPQRFCQEQELHNKWQISPGAMTTDNIWIEQVRGYRYYIIA